MDKTDRNLRRGIFLKVDIPSTSLMFRSFGNRAKNYMEQSSETSYTNFQYSNLDTFQKCCKKRFFL